MELRQYFNLLKRWYWVLILGVVLGVLGGYGLSRYQTPIYQASTKVLIMQSPEDRIQSLFAPSDQQLAETFTELLVTRPVLNATSESLGYRVSGGQVRVQRVRDAQLIQVTVQDEDPQRTADIANMLVKVFLEQNEALQSTRFTSSEESLQAQRQQVEEQISSLQDQLTQLNQAGIDAQLEQVTTIIASLQTDIENLQAELVRMEFSGAPVTLIDQEGRRSYALPTPSVDQRVEITQKNNRLLELQTLLQKYQQIFVELSFNKSGQNIVNSPDTDRIRSALLLYQEIYSNLLSNYESVRLARLSSTPNVVLVEEALPPGSPIQPRPFNNMSLGAVLGLALAAGIAFLVEYLDDTLRTIEDVEAVLELPVLANIGEIQSAKKGDGNNLPIIIDQPRSPISEAFRTLRTNLEFAELDRPLKTLLVTSSGVSEGKSTVAANLAIAIAQAGRRVILVDADLRRPHLHHILGLPNRAGLSDVLRNHNSLQSVAQKYRSEHMLVITSGSLPPNPAEVLSSDKLAQLLSDLKTQADVVIIDGPPFLLADASVLSAKVDGVLAVVRAKHTQATEALTMLDQLQRAGARVIGVAFNRNKSKEKFYYYRNLKHYGTFSYSQVEEEVIQDNGLEK